MAPPQAMSDACQQPFQRIREASEKASVGTQLCELTMGLDASASSAVQAFYDRMPETIRLYYDWKKKSSRAIVKAAQIGSLLSRAFTGDVYTDEDAYEDFICDAFTNEIEQLNSDMTHGKAIDGMQLAQDATRNFAWWEQCHKDAADGFTALSGLGGLAAFALGAVTGPVGAGVAVGAAVFSQVCFRWHRSGRNKEGKDNLAERAKVLSDVTESIQQDIIILNEIGVYVDFIMQFQQRAKKFGRISRLLKDKIASTADSIVQVCHRLLKTPID